MTAELAERAPAAVPPAAPAAKSPISGPPSPPRELEPLFIPGTALVILAGLIFTFVATIAALGLRGDWLSSTRMRSRRRQFWTSCLRPIRG